MPVEDASDKQFNTLFGLKKAIDKLSGDEDLVVADYLLRVQIFEFNLKYLWQQYCPSGIKKIPHKSFDRWTLGDTIDALEEQNDNYFSYLVPSCRNINKLRIRVVHHLLDEETDYEDVKAEIIAQRIVIDEAQKEIWHYLEWDRDFKISLLNLKQ